MKLIALMILASSVFAEMKVPEDLPLSDEIKVEVEQTIIEIVNESNLDCHGVNSAGVLLRGYNFLKHTSQDDKPTIADLSIPELNQEKYLIRVERNQTEFLLYIDLETEVVTDLIMHFISKDRRGDQIQNIFCEVNNK